MTALPPFIPSLEEGPYKVKIIREVLVDQSRDDRKIPLKLYYPELSNPASAEMSGARMDKPFPVVVWSHGLGGTRDGAGFLARYLCSHGYIIVNVQHRGTDSILWEGKPGHPWDHIRKARIPRRATIRRLQDIPFILNSLPELEDGNPAIQGLLDYDAMGMSGHSFGALTTQVMAGQKMGKGRRMYTYKDTRFKAGICYSPTMTYNQGEDPHALFGDIDIPMFYFTGTDDNSPVNGYDYRHRLQIFENAGVALKEMGQYKSQYCLILKDADHMVFAGSRGKLEENPKRLQHENAIKRVSLIFWNAYLKNDTKCQTYLDGTMKDILDYEDHYLVRS